jgi:hypothetical protein
LKERFPNCINAIKSIEFREYRWHGSLHSDMPLGLSQPSNRHNSLLLFSGLTEIFLTGCRNPQRRDRWLTNPSEDRLQNLEEVKCQLCKLLDHHKLEFHASKAPKLVVRPWQCLPGIKLPKLREKETPT